MTMLNNIALKRGWRPGTARSFIRNQRDNYELWSRERRMLRVFRIMTDITLAEIRTALWFPSDRAEAARTLNRLIDKGMVRRRPMTAHCFVEKSPQPCYCLKTKADF